MPEVRPVRVKDTIGAYGEDVAVGHLERVGFVVLARNWRCDIGEIDIVALDGETVVVCEVKTRSGFGFGSGLEAVTKQKVARLRRLAVRWLAESGRRGSSVRIDAVAVHRRHRSPLLVEHVRGVE